MTETATAKLDLGLRAAVLGRLGFGCPPPADLAGLNALYLAWCRHVPFDNVRKMIALRSANGQPLPGRDATDFFAAWLRFGAGGTCWPTSNALLALLRTSGFDARRVIGSMRDVGTPNHGSVKVRADGRDWLVDSSMLTGEPLPLADSLFIQGVDVGPAEVEAVDGTHVVWADFPPNPGHLPCRLLVDPATDAEHLAGYETSRERSPFNQRLYARRYADGDTLLLLGNTLFMRTSAGLSSRTLSREQLCTSLHRDIGLAPELVEDWVRHGCLDASFEPPAGPKPPPVGLPPSRR